MKYQICTKCVMDTSDKDIFFDEQGVCNHCASAQKVLDNVAKKVADFDVQSYVEKVKREGKGKQYDCIVGISGGVDSCYCIYLAKKYGLRPLAVHIDNGWNSEVSVQNVKKLLESMDVDLYTYEVNWQEFRELQLAFLRSSTPDSEIPTDQMIMPVLGMVAHKYGVKTIWTGANETSESILPASWSHGHKDWKYVKSVYKQFGKGRLKSYPYFNRWDLIYFYLKFEWFDILNYIDYNKEEAKRMLIEKFDWNDYGGKHHESFYTKFYQTYILPVKFGFDKRRMHASSLINAGQMTREEALKELETLPYDEKSIESDIEYFINKMEITREEFDDIMQKPTKSFWDYPNYETDFIGRLQDKVRDIRNGKN